MELVTADFNWCDRDIIGEAILQKGGSIDSFANEIDGDIFYRVGKHKTNGVVLIIPTDRNYKNEGLNEELKNSNRLN